MTNNVVIVPTALFQRPNLIVAGHIVYAPDVFPRNIAVNLYSSKGVTIPIIIHSTMTTSPEAFRQNLHGFVYSGTVLQESDISGECFISNMSYNEAYQLYLDYKKRIEQE
jgi:hypothetical protein